MFSSDLGGILTARDGPRLKPWNGAVSIGWKKLWEVDISGRGVSWRRCELVSELEGDCCREEKVGVAEQGKYGRDGNGIISLSTETKMPPWSPAWRTRFD